MSATGKRQNPGSTAGETVALVPVLAVLILGGGAVNAAAHLGATIAGTSAPPTHPAELIFGLIRGEVTWPTQSTVLLIVVAAVVLALVITVAVLRGRRRGKRSRVDSAATRVASEATARTPNLPVLAARCIGCTIGHAMHPDRTWRQ